LCIAEQHEEFKKTAEKERLIINNYKVKMQNKVAEFLKNDKVSTMQFEPSDKIFRSVISEAVEECGSGLICHTFGKEDRYVVVYKNPPSELEIEARRYYDYTKWNREIEAQFKKLKEQEAQLDAEKKPLPSTSSENSEFSKGNKKAKIIHSVECNAISDVTRSFGMVSSELKKDKRTVEETLNDIQQKKRLKTQQQQQQQQQQEQHPSERDDD
jgi:hypothetical protein